jgi:hypothetical protein
MSTGVTIALIVFLASVGFAIFDICSLFASERTGRRQR